MLSHCIDFSLTALIFRAFHVRKFTCAIWRSEMSDEDIFVLGFVAGLVGLGPRKFSHMRRACHAILQRSLSTSLLFFKMPSAARAMLSKHQPTTYCTNYSGCCGPPSFSTLSINYDSLYPASCRALSSLPAGSVEAGAGVLPAQLAHVRKGVRSPALLTDFSQSFSCSRSCGA